MATTGEADVCATLFSSNSFAVLDHRRPEISIVAYPALPLGTGIDTFTSTYALGAYDGANKGPTEIVNFIPATSVPLPVRSSTILPDRDEETLSFS